MTAFHKPYFAVKRLMDRCAVGLGVPRLLRSFGDVAGVVLVYHNVVPEGQASRGDPSLHLPVEVFIRQIEYLCVTHEIVALDALLEAPRPPGRRPAVALTFDDAYRGVCTVGLAELERRGLPATVFVAPGLLGCTSLWWDQLGGVLDGALTEDLRMEALTTAKGDADRVRRWATEKGFARRDQPEHAGVLTEKELLELAGRPGLSFGSHSWSHRNLTTLSGPALHEELARPVSWLDEKFGESFVPYLSLPYGCLSSDVIDAARNTGYAAALSLSRDMLRGDEGFVKPRVNIPAGMSMDRFVLRTVGL